MAQVTFQGVVSGQAAVGETVTITVTKPDSTTETLTALTVLNCSYTATKAYTVAGAYSAKAHVAADAQYGAADSSAVPFTIALTGRTVTLTVNLA